MAGDWFESVAEAQRRAERRLPASVAKAIRAGAERGLTLHDNVEAFAELGFAPHVAGLAAERGMSTSGMGGLPQSRECEKVQSSVTMSPVTPAARARSRRAHICSRVPAQ